MYTNINEQVAVVAIFNRGKPKVKPFKLKWHDREYVLTHVNYDGKSREGDHIVHSFHANDGSNYFELKFYAQDVKWILGRTSDNEAS